MVLKGFVESGQFGGKVNKCGCAVVETKATFSSEQWVCLKIVQARDKMIGILYLGLTRTDSVCEMSQRNLNPK